MGPLGVCDSTAHSGPHSETYLCGNWRPLSSVGDRAQALPFRLGLDDGCPCACHNGQRGIRHVVPCHNPMLEVGDPRLPRT